MDNMKNEVVEVLRLIDECQYCAVSFEQPTEFTTRRIYLELNIIGATKFGTMDADFKNLIDFLLAHDTKIENEYGKEQVYVTDLFDPWDDDIEVYWFYYQA